MAVTIAVCVFLSALSGTIVFKQDDPKGDLMITGEFKGFNLTNGLHGFHVHEFGDVRNGCMAAGAHYNPMHKDHGGPDDDDRHVGDFGNVKAESNTAKVDLKMKNVDLGSIVGRALMVHAMQDDLGKGGNDESKKTGNAGPRLDCCVIGIAKGD